MTTEIDDLRVRVDALESRLITLEEGGAAAGTASRAGSVAYDPEAFWALEGLRSRVDVDGGAVLFTGSVQLPTGEVADWQEGVTTESLLAADWSLASESIQSLGHPVRLLLLHAVLTGARTTSELSALEDVGTTGQLYHHLRPLLSSGWLRSTGRGRYEVPAPRVVPLLVMLACSQP